MAAEKSILELLKLKVEKPAVIALTGGGGKTSLIAALTRELVAGGKTVVISTTTHMAYDAGQPFCADGNPEKVAAVLRDHGYAVAAQLEPSQKKICALPMRKLRRLRELCDVLLIEADGAHGKPVKVPEEWEPVIPSFTDTVVGVIGLDCLGKTIEETAHRRVQTAEFLGKALHETVTAEDVLRIAASARGLKKGVEERDYRVYLNKSDVPADRKTAEELVHMLECRGITAAYGSLKGK